MKEQSSVWFLIVALLQLWWPEKVKLGAELTSFIRANIKHFQSTESPAESQNLTAYPIFPNTSARLVKNVVSS